ncbi:unnamed protein product [Merluccius merluccius]
MFNFGSRTMLLLLLAFPCGLIMSIGHVAAESESAEDIGHDATVDEEDEEEEDEVLVEEDQIPNQEMDSDVDEDSESADVTSHPDADTTIVFVTGEEFPSNEIVKFLVGFTNKGNQEFTVQSLEASFRYPQDFQFYIQNFTALPLNTVVQAQKQASFEYSFIPAQPMAGRPFGLVILLNYMDTEGKAFQTAIYNQTVTITELEEGLDGETMFMYIFLTGLVALMLFGMYQVLDSRTKRRITMKIEKGTSSMNDVDISWIPQETLNAMMSLCFAIVSADSTDVKCEKIYKDFSDCVLELGDSMDNYQENVTSERGVEAVCSHWEAFHTCALTALSDCQEEVGPIWETLREDSRKIRFQGSLFDLCAPSSTPSLRASLATLLPLPLLAGLITSVAAYA